MAYVKLSREVFSVNFGSFGGKKFHVVKKTNKFHCENFHKFIQFVDPDRRRWEGSEKCKLTSKNVSE